VRVSYSCAAYLSGTWIPCQVVAVIVSLSVIAPCVRVRIAANSNYWYSVAVSEVVMVNCVSCSTIADRKRASTIGIIAVSYSISSNCVAACIS